MKTIVALVVVLATSIPASAETMLYLNKDNKTWTMEKTFAFSEDCDKAARRAIREKTALGAGCAPYSTGVFSNRPASRSHASQGSQASQGTTAQKPQQQGKAHAEIMNDKNVKYHQKVYESAVESAKGQSGQAAYSNGNSYAGQNIQDAAANLQKAIDAASK